MQTVSKITLVTGGFKDIVFLPWL